jgi:hypothetical protein
VFEEGDWRIFDRSQLEKLTGIWIPDIYRELMISLKQLRAFGAMYGTQAANGFP